MKLSASLSMVTNMYLLDGAVLNEREPTRRCCPLSRLISLHVTNMYLSLGGCLGGNQIASDFGAVEDVRIPYQQQRMYGFVTFANAETVRTILARGNPHFICESRLLVKPYKEKGKILQNKWQHQQLQQLLDLYECHLGPRMFSRNTDEMMRRKADLQHAIEVELQRRRFLALQLPERENELSFSIGSPSHLPPRFNHSLLFNSESSMEETTEGDSDRGESHLHLVPNNNKERGYSSEFYNR